MITFIHMIVLNEINLKVFRNIHLLKVFKLIFNDQKLLCFKEMIKILFFPPTSKSRSFIYKSANVAMRA